MKESLWRSLNSCPRVDSTNAVAEPMSAITHIQNTAPGPPMAIAVATPARLPVPTRVATDTAKAWKEEMWRCPFSCGALGSVFCVAESVSSRNISPTMRNCTPLVFHVNQRPHATRAAINT